MPQPHQLIQQNGASPLVDVLFLIAVSLNLLKAGDLILRPSQRRWVQDKVETLTLLLDYARPLRLFQRVPKDLWTVISIIVSLILGSASIIILVKVKPGYLYYVFGSSMAWWFLYAISAFATIIFLTIFWVPQMVNWLLDDQPRFLAFIGRFLVFLVLSVAGYLGLALLSFSGLVLLPRWLGRKSMYIVEERFWDFAFSMFGFTSIKISFLSAIGLPLTVGTLVTVFGTCLLMLSILVVALRAIAWRIAEFDKGAWAAIMLSATLVLAVIEAWLRLFR